MNPTLSMLLFPLVGVLVNLIFGWRRGEKFASGVAVTFMGVAFAAALVGFLQLKSLPVDVRTIRTDLFDWISIGCRFGAGLGWLSLRFR